jgi:hypothetical protein
MMTEYMGAFFGAIAIAVFTWQGLNLIANPKEWLERHERPTTDKHLKASRFIGWMFLALVLLMLLQLVRSLLAPRPL